MIVLLAVALYGSRFRRFALFGVGICGAALVLSPVSGPLLAASLGCMVVLLGGWRLDRRFSLRAITVLTAMSVSAVVAVSFLTAQQARRSRRSAHQKRNDSGCGLTFSTRADRPL